MPSIASVRSNQLTFSWEGLLIKDPVKRDYKLTNKTRYKIWLDQITSGLRAQGLLDLMDSLVLPIRNFTEPETQLQRNFARDIIFNQIDKLYHITLLDITDLVILMIRIKEI